MGGDLKNVLILIQLVLRETTHFLVIEKIV